MPGSGGTSGFAIASLIFGVLGGVFLSVIFGFVALHQIRKRGKTGRGLAITGLVLSACWVLVIIGAVVAGVISGLNDRNASSGPGSTSTNGSVSVLKLKPGDCLNGLQGTGSIEDLPVVSCALPHEGEVYAVFDLPAGAWPGDKEVQQQAESRCDDQYESYVTSKDKTIEVLYLHPLKQSWSRDRGVTCIATDSTGPRTGSVHN